MDSELILLDRNALYGLRVDEIEWLDIDDINSTIYYDDAAFLWKTVEGNRQVYIMKYTIQQTYQPLYINRTYTRLAMEITHKPYHYNGIYRYARGSHYATHLSHY